MGSRPWKQFQDELERRGKNLTWLAERLGTDIRRVHNWKERGVPRGAWPEVAKAFGESIDWVAGLAPSRRKPPGEWDEDTRAFAAEYQALDMDSRKMLRRLFEAVNAAPRTTAPSGERPYLGGLSGFGDLDDGQDKNKQGSK